MPIIRVKNHLENRLLLHLVLINRLAHLRPKFLRNLVARALPQDRQEAEVREEVEAKFNVVTVANLVTTIRTVRVLHDILHLRQRKRKWNSSPFEVATQEVLLRPVLGAEIPSHVR